jgi:hypothetical protein
MVAFSGGFGAILPRTVFVLFTHGSRFFVKLPKKNVKIDSAL